MDVFQDNVNVFQTNEERYLDDTEVEKVSEIDFPNELSKKLLEIVELREFVVDDVKGIFNRLELLS